MFPKSPIVPLESFGDSNWDRFISATRKWVDGKVIAKVGDGSSTAISEADNPDRSSERGWTSRFPLNCEGTELVCWGSRSNLGSIIGIEAKRCRYFVVSRKLMNERILLQRVRHHRT